MPKRSTTFQYKFMRWIHRGKGIFNPLSTGWIDEHLTYVWGWATNAFFYRKGDVVIIIDVGCRYEWLEEKMDRLGLKPAQISNVPLVHLDTGRTGVVEAGSGGLSRNATVYFGEIENQYLTRKRRRRVLYRLGSLPHARTPNGKVLPRDGQVLTADDVQIECFLVPGRTWGRMVYLLDRRYLSTGDVIWFGTDGGYNFLTLPAGDNHLAARALAAFEVRFRARGLRPPVITEHTGYLADSDFVFTHRDLCCKTSDKWYFNPATSHDAYDESENTEVWVVVPL